MRRQPGAAGRKERRMSMHYWNTSGYGIDDNAVTKVNTKKIISKFVELNFNDAKEMAEDLVGNGEKAPETAEAVTATLLKNEDNTIDFLCDYYSDAYGIMDSVGIIADLVNEWFDSHGFKDAGEYLVTDHNGEEGNLIIAMGPCYPWNKRETESDEAYKSYMRLTEKDINDAFAWALREIGIETSDKPCDYVSMENWG